MGSRVEDGRGAAPTRTPTSDVVVVDGVDVDRATPHSPDSRTQRRHAEGESAQRVSIVTVAASCVPTHHAPEACQSVVDYGPNRSC
jgi:hypothetical protein